MSGAESYLNAGKAASNDQATMNVWSWYSEAIARGLLAADAQTPAKLQRTWRRSRTWQLGFENLQSLNHEKILHRSELDAGWSGGLWYGIGLQSAAIPAPMAAEIAQLPAMVDVTLAVAPTQLTSDDGKPFAACRLARSKPLGSCSTKGRRIVYAPGGAPTNCATGCCSRLSVRPDCHRTSSAVRIFDLPTIRHAHLRPIANFEYFLTRSCYLGDGMVVALVPKCTEPEAPRSSCSHRRRAA